LSNTRAKMPRRQFQVDLQKAAEGLSIAGISNVRPGGDDGEFTFMCLADGQQLEISALVPGKLLPVYTKLATLGTATIRVALYKIVLR